jgi:hypothetical protein
MAKKKQTLRKNDGTGEATVEINTDLSTKEGRADSLCPTCGVFIESHRCRLCGATRTVNAVSGNVIWMRNGRLVAAFHDEKSAWQRVAQEHGIPDDQTPARFRED